MMSQCDTTKVLNRLKRIEGQLRGIQKMIVDEKASCKDIIIQMTAVRSGVNSLMGMMLAENLMNIMEDSQYDSDQKEKRLSEAIEMIMKK